MASAEQNALLALQLFGAPAAQFNAQNDARTNLLYKLTMANREEQLKRDLLAEQDQRSFKLAEMQATREDKRWEAQGKREDAREKARNDLENSRKNERELADIRNEIDRLYPQYAAAAARANIPIKQRSEFPETRAGLGQLTAEFQTAQVGFEQKKLAGAADALVSDLDETQAAISATKNRLAELSKPSPEDEKFARTRAIAALKTAIESGTIESAKKLRPDAITKGLAELRKGNDETAAKFLGDEAIGAFQGALEQTLMALPNTKSRLQERAQANQQLMQLQTMGSRVHSDLRKAAATNPFLAEKLTERKSALSELMAPEPAAKARSFDDIFKKPEGATGGATGTWGGEPEPQASATPKETKTAPRSRFDFNTLGFVPGEAAPIVDTPGDSRTRANEAIADLMRATGYGVTNLFRPSNWQGSDNAIYYAPERGSLIPQLQSRLGALTDPMSPTAQTLRNRLLELQAAQ